MVEALAGRAKSSYSPGWNIGLGLWLCAAPGVEPNGQVETYMPASSHAIGNPSNRATILTAESKAVTRIRHLQRAIGSDGNPGPGWRGCSQHLRYCCPQWTFDVAKFRPTPPRFCVPNAATNLLPSERTFARAICVVLPARDRHCGHLLIVKLRPCPYYRGRYCYPNNHSS
jgi:hypothetical protein